MNIIEYTKVFSSKKVNLTVFRKFSDECGYRPDWMDDFGIEIYFVNKIVSDTNLPKNTIQVLDLNVQIADGLYLSPDNKWYLEDDGKFRIIRSWLAVHKLIMDRIDNEFQMANKCDWFSWDDNQIKDFKDYYSHLVKVFNKYKTIIKL